MDERVLPDESPRDIAPTVFAAIISSGIAALAVKLLPARAYRETPFMGVYVALLIGVAVLFWTMTIAGVLRRRRFGATVCTLDHVPVRPGETLRGTIDTLFSALPEEGVAFHLQCYRYTRTTKSTHEKLLYEDEWVVDKSVLLRGARGFQIPFAVRLRGDAPSTNRTDSREWVAWQLSAFADLPGVDFDAQFTMPIVAAPGGPSAAEIVEADEADRRKMAAGVPSARSRVTIASTDPLEVRIRGSYSAVNALVGFGVVAVMSAIAYGVWQFEDARCVAAGVSLLALLMAWGWLDAVFGTSIIRVTGTGVELDRASLGMHFRDTVDVRLIRSVTASRNGTIGQYFFYDVRMNLNDDKANAVGSYLATRRDASIIASRVEEAIGRMRPPS